MVRVYAATSHGSGDGNPPKQANVKESPPIGQQQLEHWMRSLIEDKPEVLDWPITKLCYPGTHDSATYGPGVFPTNLGRFNWQCQDLNLYEQACIGVRYFDLRLQQESRGRDSLLYPFHGDAVHTGDVFSKSHHEAGGQETIAGQVLKFVKEHPSELIILSITAKNGTTAFSSIILNVLKDHLMEAPKSAKAGESVAIPTVRQMIESAKNILIMGAHLPREEQSGSKLDNAEKFIWDVPGPAVLVGEYNGRDWKSNDPTKVQAAIEKWMASHAKVIYRRNHFWNAQCQLTPKINNVWDAIKSIWDDSMTTSPRKLSVVMNPFVQDTLMQDAHWKKNASIVTVDFPDPTLVLSIVMLNFEAASEDDELREQRTLA